MVRISGSFLDHWKEELLAVILVPKSIDLVGYWLRYGRFFEFLKNWNFGFGVGFTNDGMAVACGGIFVIILVSLERRASGGQFDTKIAGFGSISAEFGHLLWFFKKKKRKKKLLRVANL
jgi:hypothetical protein